MSHNMSVYVIVHVSAYESSEMRASLMIFDHFALSTRMRSATTSAPPADAS